MRYRILLAAVLICGLSPSKSDAFPWSNLFQPNQGNQVQPQRPGLPIVHYGYGYVYDPYNRATFEMQDPLQDPLFQAQHKFDSRFPGRYTPKQKREFQQNMWKTFQR